MKKNKLIVVLLAIYVLILTWIILFKMQFSFEHLPYIRSINLIPFGESVIVNGKIYFNEIINNLIVFVPIGLYIGILGKEQKLYKKLLSVLAVTLALEILQYVFHIGATDITDVIMNTAGGAVGILIINALYKIFKNTETVDKVLKVLALICTILVVGFILLLIVANL